MDTNTGQRTLERRPTTQEEYEETTQAPVLFTGSSRETRCPWGDNTHTNHKFEKQNYLNIINNVRGPIVVPFASKTRKCHFLSFLVISCHFMSLLVTSCHFLSLLVTFCDKKWQAMTMTFLLSTIGPRRARTNRRPRSYLRGPQERHVAHGGTNLKNKMI